MHTSVFNSNGQPADYTTFWYAEQLWKNDFINLYTEMERKLIWIDERYNEKSAKRVSATRF